MQNPDDWHPNRTQLFGEPIDWLDDVARSGHFRRRSRGAEQLLHIDDEEHGTPRIKFLEPMITAASCQNAIDDFLANAYSVHFVLKLDLSTRHDTLKKGIFRQCRLGV
jgi:hypothetical protein